MNPEQQSPAAPSQRFTFDRTADVSKLEGCNTRGVGYRWDIFKRHLEKLPIGAALDFGAGSLRDSFELAVHGFRVTAIDIDLATLAAYRARYVWPNDALPELVAGPDLLKNLALLAGRKFSLITCFDVLEHLADPVAALRALAAHLDHDGLLFVTVPNGRSLFEIVWRIDLMLARATGRVLTPGEPHLQRNSPAKWKRLIRDAGLSILEHDIQIGFFANTSAALIQVPLAMIGRVARKSGIKLDAIGLADRIIDGPQASVMDFLDRHTSSFLKPLYAWNLFVLAKTQHTGGNSARQ
ncbi:MAG: class I SAM-dependent methyltransferase [Steroidobacteraceae bacterium]